MFFDERAPSDVGNYGPVSSSSGPTSTYSSGLGGLHPSTGRGRMPKIDEVARELRAVSSRMLAVTPVYLYVALNGDWAVQAGAPDPTAPGWVAVAEVPGTHKGKPRRFKSTDIARGLIGEVRLNKAGGGTTRATMPTIGPPGVTNVTPGPSDLGALVMVHKAVGRVRGHTVVYGQFGPQYCTLVEFEEPQYVSAWDMYVQVIPVADSMVKPAIQGAPKQTARRTARGSSSPVQNRLS